MLKIEKKYNLTKLSTLKVKAVADFFAVICNKEDLFEAMEFSKKNKQKITILGGGSNILFKKRVEGLVLKNEIKGMRIAEDDKDRVLVEGLAGESWSKFVSFTVSHKIYGLENLFLIYGTVGAAPVQNIGAYGVELKDVFHHLKAINLKTGSERIFSIADCHFGYRDSIFKNKLKGKYFIYSVTLSLSRKENFKLDYGSIREKLEDKGIKEPNAREVIKVIEEIRNSKLPNPHTFPNAGSFFKNPEISQTIFKKLLKLYPDIPSFPGVKNKIKIPAAWLIDQAGFKGKKLGAARVYEKQALIIINDGGASAQQILRLTDKVKLTVKEKFGIDLKEEINII